MAYTKELSNLTDGMKKLALAMQENEDTDKDFWFIIPSFALTSLKHSYTIGLTITKVKNKNN